MEDRLKINAKSLNQFQNGLTRIGRLRLKQGQKTNLSLTKKIQKILKDIFKIKIKYIKKKVDLLRNALVNVQKRKRLFEKGLKKIAKMNLITLDLSRDELEQIEKIRKIKYYEYMNKKI